MHIFEKGAVFSNSENGIRIECDVLVADIFELNMDMKAMVMVEVHDEEHIINISMCNTFECEALAVANVFHCIFRDCGIEADYGNGNIARVYIKVPEIDHQECRVVSNNFDSIKSIF